MSAVTLKSLLANIQKAMEFPREGNLYFVPETVLAQLMNPQVVEGVLLEQTLKLKLRTPISELAQFFSKEAFKVFTILAENNLLHLIEHFYENGFCDDMLPVQKRWLTEDSYDWEVESCNKKDYGDVVRKTFCFGDGSPWDHEAQIASFCELWQWPFIAPVFVKGNFRYEFPTQTRLPFTSTGKRETSDSFYSYVEEKTVHVDHLPKDLEIAVDSRGNPRVAIKKLKRSGKDFESVAEGEAVVLEMMRELKNEHLIKAIAYYRKGNGHHFMFPWAEMGNLWNFWQQNSPKTERHYMIWVFTQLTGLARAIQELHHLASRSQSCRHGDLKPANILCFKTKGGQDDSPRLVITDVGLARVHNQATSMRDKTASTVGTQKYAAPELGIDPKAPRSRRFDIWSIGCIFLEFVIWLLYGTKKLQEFSNDLQGAFYELEILQVASTAQGYQFLSPGLMSEERRTAKVNPTVEKWISYIRSDWRCSNGSAVERLVELIVTRMLKVDVNNAGPLNDMDKPILSTGERTAAFHTTGTIVAEPLAIEEESDSEAQASGIRQATWKNERQFTDDLPRDPSCRAYAPEIRENLAAILADLERGDTEPIGGRPSAETPTLRGLSPSRPIENGECLGVSNVTQVS